VPIPVGDPNSHLIRGSREFELQAVSRSVLPF